MTYQAYGAKKGPLHGLLISTPYVTKDHLQLKRFQAQTNGTTYAYDFPEMFRQVCVVISLYWLWYYAMINCTVPRLSKSVLNSTFQHPSQLLFVMTCTVSYCQTIADRYRPGFDRSADLLIFYLFTLVYGFIYLCVYWYWSIIHWWL